MNKKQAKAMLPIIDRYESALKDFNICDLGSCQYSTINDTHNFIMGIHELGGIALVNEILQLSYKEISLETFEEYLYTTLKALSIEELAEETDMEDCDLSTALNAIPGVHATKRVTIEQYYEICRDSSWDLWSAVESPVLDLTIGLNLDLPTRGPIFNELAQGENYEIGVHLALTTIFFGTNISAFADFDT